MANLPAKSLESAVPERIIQSLVRQMAAGVHPRTIARKKFPHPHERSARNHYYTILKRLALGDDRVAEGIVEEVRLEMITALGPAAGALGRRASTGRPDAIKLLFEASGFHNPKVSHEHSGEINIKLDMPRPKQFEPEEPVTDATVVED